MIVTCLFLSVCLGVLSFRFKGRVLNRIESLAECRVSYRIVRSLQPYRRSSDGETKAHNDKTVGQVDRPEIKWPRLQQLDSKLKGCLCCSDGMSDLVHKSTDEVDETTLQLREIS